MKISATFVSDKETKNTYRFAEPVKEGERAKIPGSIYILKSALNGNVKPSKVKVTIEF